MPTPFGASRVSTGSTRRGSIDIEPQNSDPGITLTLKPNALTIRGTAAGPRARLAGSDEDPEVSRGFSVYLDKKTKPHFDYDLDHRRSNEWTFAHDFGVGTKKGWSAEQCARALATEINEKETYRAKVSVARDGAATISLTAR